MVDPPVDAGMPRMTEECPDPDILFNRIVQEGTDQLKRSGDAESDDFVGGQTDYLQPIKEDRSRGRLLQTRDDVKQGTLSSPVGSNQPHDFALLDRERNFFQGYKAAEVHVTPRTSSRAKATPPSPPQ